MTTAAPVRRVLTAPTTLGLATRERFRREANAALDALPERTGQLVIDLADTQDVDSSGLSVLVWVQRHAADRRQQVLLRHVGPHLEYLLVLTKLDDLFFLEAPA